MEAPAPISSDMKIRMRKGSGVELAGVWRRATSHWAGVHWLARPDMWMNVNVQNGLVMHPPVGTDLSFIWG